MDVTSKQVSPWVSFSGFCAGGISTSLVAGLDELDPSIVCVSFRGGSFVCDGQGLELACVVFARLESVRLRPTFLGEE